MDKLVLCSDYIDEHELIKRGETISSTLFVHFYSDPSLSGIGFELSYAHTEGKIPCNQKVGLPNERICVCKCT